MNKKMLALSVAVAVAAMISAPTFADDVTIQLGFENSASEPIGQALEKWAQLVEEKGDGSLKIELYPDSQLGSKSELIDGMTFGESYMTLADGAFYADYGVKDFGIVFGPFLFDNWDQCWALPSLTGMQISANSFRDRDFTSQLPTGNTASVTP